MKTHQYSREAKTFMLILVLAQILLTVVGQMLWKKSIDQSGGLLDARTIYCDVCAGSKAQPAVLTGTALYLGATSLWFYLLSRFELTYIYPFLSLTFIVLFVEARVFLGEQISLQRWIAVTLIAFGVFLMTRT